MGCSKILNLWDFENIEINNFMNLINKDKISYSKPCLKDFNIKDNNEKCKKDNFKDNKNESNEKDNKERFKNNNGKNKEKNKNIQLAFPIISMLTINQVKAQLFELLPKFFFKVGNIYSFNTLSDVDEGIKLDPEECVLPLMIEFADESFNNWKIKYSNPLGLSPFLNFIKNKNTFLCRNDYGPESGYILEKFIVNNNHEFKFLKFRNIDLFPLTDVIYWTDINFNKMKKFNRNTIEKTGFKYENLEYFNKRNYDDEDENIHCYFKKYNNLLYNN